MSRSSLTLALLLAAGTMLAACSDRSTPGPTAPGKRALAFDRTSAAPDTRIVRGSGNPAIDVAAVQAAVDQGGAVILKGHFSFDAPPSTNNGIAPDLLVAGGFPTHAEVKITKAVRIFGGEDEDGAMTTIDAGTIPFYIEAPNQTVTIRRLRFVRPISHAILVAAVRGLEITSNKVEGLKPFTPIVNGAIGIFSAGGIPSPTKPGNPSNVSGGLVIADNDFDVTGGTATDNVLGITVFSAGESATPVEARVSGNRIRNNTEPAINFRRVVGRVSIDHNVINTGSIGVAAARNQVIRVVNLGSYVIAHNSIDCSWPISDAEGIGVFSQFAAWPMDHAIVEDNEITMSAPSGTAFTAFSAGIGVYGFAQNNIVRRNRVRGRALAGVSIPVFPLSPQAPAAPQDNEFIRNRFIRFTPSDADFFIGEHAVRTRILGAGTVDDHGTGTIIVPSGREHRPERRM